MYIYNFIFIILKHIYQIYVGSSYFKNVFLFCLYKCFVFMCVCVMFCFHVCVWGSEEGIGYTGTRIINDCELQCRC